MLGNHYSLHLTSKGMDGASLGVQWLRIHLPAQGTWVQSLVCEDPTRRGTAKLVRHDY